MPTASKKEADQLISKLATGINAKYTGKAKPLKAKEAKNADEIGKFTRKEYESIFRLDDRLTWEKTKGGWIGSIKNYHLIVNDNKLEK